MSETSLANDHHRGFQLILACFLNSPGHVGAAKFGYGQALSRRRLSEWQPGAFSAQGRRVAGVVAELRLRYAVVLDGGGQRWRVPYPAISVVERSAQGECSLVDVEYLAEQLLASHKA